MRVHPCLPAAFVLAACQAAGHVYPAFDEHPPKRVRVVLLDDRSGEPNDSSSARDCCERLLAARGYAIALAADATLQITVERCERRLEPSSSEWGWVAEVSAALYDDGSGELLWSDRGSAHQARSEEDRGDWNLLGLFDFTPESAARAASDDDARDVLAGAVRWALESLPPARSRVGAR